MTKNSKKQTIKLRAFRPRLVHDLKHYNTERLSQDVIAGITVGVVALPLAMAFAIASGLQPQVGLYTAIVAGFLVSALGGSRVQIGGPAGAFIVVVLSILNQYGLANLLLSTFLAGILLFLMGLTGLGSLVRLIPVSIVIGFTNGIAVLIVLSQIPDFLGLGLLERQSNFFQQNWNLIQAVPGFHATSTLLAIGSLVFLFLWPKLFSHFKEKKSNNKFPKLLGSAPGSVLVLVMGTLLALILKLDVETIGSRFGSIPNTLPDIQWPELSFNKLNTLIGPTLTIAFLCAVESLLCARVADGITREKHDPNQELMAQGIANIASPMVGGMPATGAIARTVTNIRSGASSPVAGIVHSITLLLIMLLAAPLAEHIPLAVLSAILMFVAYNMGEWREFPKLKQYSLIYKTIMVSTFLLTVIVDLTVAVQVGLVLAAVFFIYQVSSLTEFTLLDLPSNMKDQPVKAYNIYGSLFFAVIGKIEALTLEEKPQVLILDLHQTISIDTTALESLEELAENMQRAGHLLIFAGLNKQAQSLFRRSGLQAKLEARQIQPNLQQAFDQAAHYLCLRENIDPIADGELRA